MNQRERAFHLGAMALGIAWLGACDAPSAQVQRLQVRSDKIGYSAGPPPYYGFTLFGSLVIKDLPAGLAVGPQSTPRTLIGAHGKGEFMPRLSLVRIVDGVFFFRGTLDEKSYWDATGLLDYDPAVRVEFEDPGGRKWSARGTMETISAGHPAHPDLERALKE